MRYVMVTQRVEVVKEYGERRDCLDQNWSRLIHRCGGTPLIVPNHLEAVEEILKKATLQGIVLTGGNNLSKYGGDAPERDEVERRILEFAMENDVPLLGVCRGMQVIQDYFGVKLQKVNGHVATRHTFKINGREMAANSYHNYASQETVDAIEVLARSNDGVVEAVKHKGRKVYGMMHHPERTLPFRQEDLRYVKSVMEL